MPFSNEYFIRIINIYTMEMMANMNIVIGNLHL